MTRPEQDNQKDRALLESRLAYHLRCLREDATDQALTSLERLALVRGRADRIRHIRQGTEGRKVVMGDVMGDVGSKAPFAFWRAERCSRVPGVRPPGTLDASLPRPRLARNPLGNLLRFG